MSNGHLNIEFTDGVKFGYEVNDLIYEIDKKEPLGKIALWDSSLNKKPKALFKKNIFETKCYTLLIDRQLKFFYKNQVNTFLFH